jgi:hypothetical protein
MRTHTLQAFWVCEHISHRYAHGDKLFNKKKIQNKSLENKPDGGVHRHILHLLALTEEPKLSADEKKKNTAISHWTSEPQEKGKRRHDFSVTPLPPWHSPFLYFVDGRQ